MPKFQSGQCWNGNPHGRPRKPEIEMFREAIKLVETQKGKTLLVHAVERCFADDQVLVALLKKILPDKVDVDFNDEVRMEQIKTEMRELFIKLGVIKG